MRPEDFVRRADELISEADWVLARTPRSGTGSGKPVPFGEFCGFRLASLSFLLSTFGPEHPYYREFNTIVDSSTTRFEQDGREVLIAGRQILDAARNEMAGGWTATVRGIISAEIFSDFLEMAAYLLSQGYKDAAAVMIGSVLEEHLRQLCGKHGIDLEMLVPDGSQVPKRADRLNADLTKAEVYSKLDQKNVTTWLGLRNEAAHGNYDAYARQQVEIMLQSVTDFMARVPIA